ncbi:MAG: insulinase family protein [Candidatus Azobacteroides sp.]|nr:insulinase family protein [Candidatus Azobacteroides sp.]
MQYSSFVSPVGLRIIHLPSDSPVSYCGFVVHAGTRDERFTQYGLAHFVEHMLFKGTEKRKVRHILNRMEAVGGELNAYTTKEETFLYTVCLREDVERAIELLSDLIFRSQFPETEIEKEREVVIDEIHSYEDTPSELIFDEFENRIFAGNDLGHAILGEEESIQRFTSATCRDFVSDFYRPENMVFFSYGKTPFSRIRKYVEKYLLASFSGGFNHLHRCCPKLLPAETVVQNKNLHQTHVVIGGRAYGLFDEKRMGLLLLTNILGGPGMNSRLNVNLREKYGLVYTVDAEVLSYTDTGVFTVYFGCDSESMEQCLHLVRKELKQLRDKQLSESQFAAAVKQWKGQLGIASEHKENAALRLGKNFLHFNRYDALPQTYQKIEALTAEGLLEIANEIYEEKRLFSLIYQ